MTGADLLAQWSWVAEIEESVPAESVVFRTLATSPDGRSAIETHLAITEAILRDMPSAIAERYLPWSLDRTIYRFGSEAFHQSQVIYWLRNASKTRSDVANIRRTFVARHVLRPSAINGTPRIKQVDALAFIIYPAPGTAWLYEMMGALHAEMSGGRVVEQKLEEYLLYLLAYRAFEAHATCLTAYGIDFLIDEIVMRGQAPVAGHPVEERTARIVQGIEDFVVNHELSHEFLAHAPGSDCGFAIEAAADALAIKLMLTEKIARSDWKDGGSIAVSDRPFIGYLGMHLWGMFRETGEWRAAAFLADTPELMTKVRSRTRQLSSLRTARIDAVQHLSRVEVSAEAHEIVAAGSRLNKRLQTFELNPERAVDVVRLARALAESEYFVLREEIRRVVSETEADS